MLQAHAAKQAVDVSESLVPSGLFSQFREWRTRLSTSEISVSKERLLLRNPQMLESDPELALRLMSFTARHGLVPAPSGEGMELACAPEVEASVYASSRSNPVWGSMRHSRTSIPSSASRRQTPEFASWS